MRYEGSNGDLWHRITEKENLIKNLTVLALLSHFIIWTVEENQEAPNSQTAQKLRKYGLSKLLSALKILISGVSTGWHYFLQVDYTIICPGAHRPDLHCP